MRDAVLENDIRNAQWQARVLATATDYELAEAALSAKLIELEALYQRAPTDVRVLRLLVQGYTRMAQGFIEARRVEALALGEAAEAARQAERRRAALARGSFYATAQGVSLPAPKAPPATLSLSRAEAACQARDLPRYEQELSLVLAAPDASPEARLDNALQRRLARSWLAPKLRARCGF